MAKLRGVVEADKSSASRLSNHRIGATLNTWDGKIDVTLLADGGYRVTVNNKLKASGNVNEEQG